MLTVEKYCFLVACSKKVHLSGLYMSQQYNVGNREGEEERGKGRKEGEESEQEALWGLH